MQISITKKGICSRISRWCFLSNIPSNESSIKLNLVPRFKPFDSDDSTSLASMSRKNTIDIGIKSRFQIKDFASLKIELFKELTDKHEGSLFDVSIRKFFMNDMLPVSAALGSNGTAANAPSTTSVFTTQSNRGSSAYSPGAVVAVSLSFHILQILGITSCFWEFFNGITALASERQPDS